VYDTYVWVEYFRGEERRDTKLRIPSGPLQIFRNSLTFFTTLFRLKSLSESLAYKEGRRIIDF